jgi:ABC-2 type transport system permease protein
MTATVCGIGLDDHRADARRLRVSAALRAVVVLAWRNLVHIMREPMQLSDVTIQPILFTALFVYIFGGGIPIPGGTFKQFAIAGLLMLNLVTSSMGTTIGLATDLSTGVIDRFRTLPMWHAAVLIGRSIADLLTSILAMAFVLITGLVVGWRPEAAVGSVFGGLGLALVFTYALAWMCSCFGIAAKGPESGASVGFLLLFPLAMVSNAFIPTQHMPEVVRSIAEWNPVSAVIAAVRDLFGNPNPSASVHVWPMEHPVVASLAWTFSILVVCAPLAAHLYRRRTTQ